MAQNILATRRHKVLEARADQIGINILAYHGGTPYIDARLCRFPAESDIDFFGSFGGELNEKRFNTSGGATRAIGRKDRAFLINYARRVAAKINQYVFATSPQRENADPAFLLDATATGMSLNQFMGEISSLVTAARWCWIGIDRPASSGSRSIAARERAGDRVYWQIYDPTEVVDWSFGSNGRLNWLITQTSEYLNGDPRQEAKTVSIRYLYEPGKVTRLQFNGNKDDFDAQIETPIGMSEIPFVLGGMISDAPWWFDDLERIQRAVMDLHSSRDHQIFRAVFALLVISRAFADHLSTEGITTTEARRKIGIGNPLIETADESGLTRYLEVPTTVFATIRDAINDLQAQLYEIVGLNMSVPESRQVASAEAKQWDHLDPETVLRERATLLEEVEGKAVEMSRQLGGGVFTPWQPVYGKKFDISDFEADLAALTSVGALSLPASGEKIVQKCGLRAIAKHFGIDAKELQDALAEVDSYDPEAVLAAMRTQMTQGGAQ